MATNTQRAAEARAKAQQQAKAKERRTTLVIIASAVLVIAAFAGIVAFIVNSSKVPELPEAHAPAPADASGGIPVGTGGVVGVDVPTDAVRVDLYLDLMCPVCKRLEQVNSADIDAMREAGTIAVYYHPVAILNRFSQGTKYPSRASNAVAVVADRDPGHFLDFIAALYANQPEEKTPGLDDATIAQIAEGVGVPSDVAASFKKGEFSAWVSAATDQASIDGMTVTPTVMVNGQILDPKLVPFFQEGVVKTYLESLPKPDGTPPGPGGK